MLDETDDAFDLGTAALPGDEFHRLLARYRERGAVVPARLYGQPVRIITRFDALQQALRDGKRFPPETSYQRSIEPVVGRTFISMPQQQHNLYRKLATPAFRTSALKSQDDADIAAICRRLLEPIERDGGGDLVATYTRRLPLIVISRMLGLPEQSDEDFQRWALALLSFPVDPAAAERAAHEFSAFVLPIVRRRRAEPGTDVISALAQAEVEGRRLDDEEILSHIRLLFPTGADTTYLALGNLIYALLTQHDSWWRLCAEPAAAAAAVEEGLRWESPTPLIPRLSAAHDIEFGGVSIPAQTPLLFGIGAANRDPVVFAQPDRFDIGRHIDTALTFGPGLRTCPGMHLARKELRIALEVLLARCPGLRLLDVEAARPRQAILRGPQALRVALR